MATSFKILPLCARRVKWRDLRQLWGSLGLCTALVPSRNETDPERLAFRNLPWETREVVLQHERLNGSRLGMRRRLLAKIFDYTQLGFSPGGLMFALERDPRFLRTKSDQVKENVQCLYEFGFKRAHVEQLLMGAPWILRARRERMEAFLTYFHQTLRLPRHAVAKLCAKDPQVASLDLEKRIIPCVHYFTRELEMPRDQFVAMVEKFPRLLVLPVDLRLRPIIAYFLDDLAIPKEKFLYHLRYFPGVLGCSLKKSVQFRVQWLQEVSKTDPGIVPSVCLRGLVLFQTRSAFLMRNYEILLSALNRDVDLAARILRRVPHVLSWSSISLQQQFNFVKMRLRRDVTELYHFPSLLGMSFKEKVFPRLEVMERMAFDYSQCPLFLLFGTPDAVFNKLLESKLKNAHEALRERERRVTELMMAFDEEPLHLTAPVSEDNDDLPR